jgi:hypothetical protein
MYFPKWFQNDLFIFGHFFYVAIRNVYPRGRKGCRSLVTLSCVAQFQNLDPYELMF